MSSKKWNVVRYEVEETNNGPLLNEISSKVFEMGMDEVGINILKRGCSLLTFF